LSSSPIATVERCGRVTHGADGFASRRQSHEVRAAHESCGVIDVGLDRGRRSAVIALIDEVAPEDKGGIYYVVTAAVLLGEEADAHGVLSELLPPGRRRAFHWCTEGRTTREAMIGCIDRLGVVAHVCVHYPTGRRRQEAARAAAFDELLPVLIGEGVDHLIIESRAVAQDGRDKQAILEILRRNKTPSALTYEWRGKGEPLLWIADAIAGSVRDHLMGDTDVWLDALRRSSTVGELRYQTAK